MTSGMGDRQEHEKLSARVAALEQLLEVHESIVAEQSQRLLAEKNALTKEQIRMRLLHGITVAANQASHVRDVEAQVLRSICEHAQACVGHLYTSSGGGLEPADCWHAEDDPRFERFRAVTARTRLAPGVELPGRVLLEGRALWSPDLSLEKDSPRSACALADGLKAGFAFPLLVGTRVAAVFECFFLAPTPPDEELQTVLENIGIQLGRVMEREEADEERKALYKQLVDASREAGRAEVSTNILHNVGNVLNSVNVSATMISDVVKQFRFAQLAKVSSLIRDNERDLAGFFENGERGKLLPEYIEKLSSQLMQEQTLLLRELESLTANVTHIKEIVNMQQEFSRVYGVAEIVNASDLFEDVLKLNTAALSRHGVTIAKEYGDNPKLTVDRHKVLQILVNLVRNAKYALDGVVKDRKRLTLRAARSGAERVVLSVLDNGVGISAENMKRIFCHGFTTRKEGHGFGLHNSILAAKELGGELSAHSDGPGKGATFTLQLPLCPPATDG